MKNMKFDKLVNSIITENSGLLAGDSGADAIRAHERAKSERIADANARSGYSGYSDQAFRSRERNAGLESVRPHYIVFGDEKCKAWYQKTMPDSTMATSGWKAFFLSRKYDARLAAKEFADKWGLKEPRYVAG